VIDNGSREGRSLACMSILKVKKVREFGWEKLFSNRDIVALRATMLDHHSSEKLFNFFHLLL